MSAVDEYLAGLSPEQRQALEQLRVTIMATTPEAEQVIRRRVPAFRYHGRPLVSIGAARRHLSLYIMHGAVLHRHRAQLEGFDTSNTVVRFTPDNPIPPRLVTSLLRGRMAEIDDHP